MTHNHMTRDYTVTDSTAEYRLSEVRRRHKERIDSGMAGGVREWFEIGFLLNYIAELETGWEYSIKVVYPSGVEDIYGDWSDRKHIEADLLWFRSDDARRRLRNDGCVYSMVRRNMAGKPEDVD